MKNIKVAIAGNPNSGKTTIFNAITGARQHVGNYPGVTVEKREGVRKFKHHKLDVVDLPGTYCLTAYSVEEVVTRDFIINEHPDVVVDVLDASNIERNLYLATQLMEMDVPLVLVFNMSDVAKSRGLVFDLEMLSSLLGARIVETVGNKGLGIDELLDVVVATAEGDIVPAVSVSYGGEIEEEIDKIETMLAEDKLTIKYSSRYLAIKLLENDSVILSKVKDAEVLEVVDKSREHVQEIFGDRPEIILADRRYGFISGACQETIKNTVESRHDVSDMIDKVVTHKVLGLPIFVGLMYVVFQMTFKIGSYPMGWLEVFFGYLGGVISGLFGGGVFESLIVDGIIGGVGGVIVFLPNIILLFLAIAFLEDTGYMARAAFIMDRLMHKIGLHGKSFIPMLIGFGCSVPAIMATRILENRRSRLTTILVIPLMSCGARLPIYMLIIPAFFAEKWRGPMMWLMYFIGVALAVVCAKLLRKTLFKGDTTPFVMELPPYRMPTGKGLLIHMWERGWEYLKKAGTVILAISILLWAAGTFPKTDVTAMDEMAGKSAEQVQLEGSVVGKLGKAIEPVIKPLGFDWKIGTALIGAAAAKEVFVSQMSIVYSLGDDEEGVDTLREKLRENYSPLQGFCVMLFCLISAPCMATVAVTRRETGTWKWAAVQYFGLTAIAYVLTLVVYQAGVLVGRL